MSIATSQDLELRVADLERNFKELRHIMTSKSLEPRPKSWLDTVGVFQNDDQFASIMERGRQYRESLRPAEAD